jgi:hypothetical protein
MFACRNALAFGENSAGTASPFIGAGDFALSRTDDASTGDRSWSLFLFHWAFSAAAATIMAGAVAERMTLIVYLGYTCLMTTLVSAGDRLGPEGLPDVVQLCMLFNTRLLGMLSDGACQPPSGTPPAAVQSGMSP